MIKALSQSLCIKYAEETFLQVVWLCGCHEQFVILINWNLKKSPLKILDQLKQKFSGMIFVKTSTNISYFVLFQQTTWPSFVINFYMMPYYMWFYRLQNASQIILKEYVHIKEWSKHCLNPFALNMLKKHSYR
jgi:hypothetical protein